MVASRQHVGHLVLDDHPRQAFGDGRLADTGLAHVQRVVLAPAAQNLDGPLDLELAPDQRIDLALAGRIVEVGRVLLQAHCPPPSLSRSASPVAPPPSSRSLRSSPPALDRPWAMKLTTSSRDTSCMLKQVGGVRLLLAENRHQHVGDGDFFLAARLHVEHRPLQHPLEAQGRLHVAVLAGRQPRRRLVDELLQFGLELRGVGTARLEDFPHLRGIDDGEQQVLDGHEFVPRLTRAGKGIIQAKFEFLTKHGLRLF